MDNASSDNSLDGLSDFGLPINIVRNIVNRGFAAACNQGASGSTADYLLFLNPDTILNCDSLSRPIIFLEDHSNKAVGIVGIKLVNESGDPNLWCCRFPTARMFLHEMTGLSYVRPDLFPGHVMTEWTHDDTRDYVDHVLGAFLPLCADFSNIRGRIRI